MSKITFIFNSNEQLPPVVWEYLVKRRANFKCQGSLDKHSKELESHHKDRNRSNNRLSNGKCLCSLCHGDTRKIKYQPRRKLRKFFFLAGKRKYKELLDEIKSKSATKATQEFIRKEVKKSPYPNLLSKEEFQDIAIEELCPKEKELEKIR